MPYRCAKDDTGDDKGVTKMTKVTDVVAEGRRMVIRFLFCFSHSPAGGSTQPSEKPRWVPVKEKTCLIRVINLEMMKHLDMDLFITHLFI